MPRKRTSKPARRFEASEALPPVSPETRAKMTAFVESFGYLLLKNINPAAVTTMLEARRG